ncbi:hypothetical protein D3C76_27650 [compost metagenome]
MTQCTIARTAEWFALARPEPTVQDFNAQLGVHCEEVSEMLEELDGENIQLNVLIGTAQQAMHNLAEYLKNNSAENLVHVARPLLFLDSLCDQVVTATGVAHTLNYEFVGAMKEVNASNFSKFDDEGNPIYNENKKVMKGPNYFKADLAQYLPVE